MLALVAALTALAAPSADVRATLADGQVLLGEVRTRTLRLATGAGVVDIPLSDVGEVVPARAEDLQAAEGLVDVWLRNGSELRGRWTDPKLAMDIAVGGKDVTVDLPMNELARFQLQGGERWPGGPVYRMRTAWGDDLLVDPTKTEIVLENQLGTFAPRLSECRSVAPIGDPTGEWRIELQTGTVLRGKLQDDAVTVALPMGPKALTVPLESFVSLRVETWTPKVAQPAPRPPQPVTTAQAAPGAAATHKTHAVAPRKEEAPAAKSDGWFDSSALESSKRAYDE